MLQKKSLFTGILLLTSFISSLSVRAQVNLQTGSAVFSIPMFDWHDEKSRLNATVALSYNSGNGLRVSDVASNVGQGWNLIAGGVITRMQVGEPDDQMARDPSTNEMDISRYPAGYLYAPVAAYKGCPSALTKYPIYKKMNQVYTQHNTMAEDREMDYFSFQFNGKNGLFILNPTSATTGNGVMIGYSNLKITYQLDPSLPTTRQVRTTLSSFSIQDEDGLIYKFTLPSSTQVLHSDFCDANITQPQTQPTFKGNHVYHQAGFTNSKLVNPTVYGSWYLTQIYDPLTQRSVNFTYVQRTVNNIAGADFSYSQNGDYSTISHKTSITTAQDISTIILPDSEMVTFNYAPTTRYDLNGEKALSSVDITYNDGVRTRYLSEYQLSTSYFILNRYGTPTTAYQKSVARLCLRSVRKLGVDRKADSPPYIFDYYMGSNSADDFVPPPFYFAKDIWGFYNGNNSVDYNGAAIDLHKNLSTLTNTDIKGLCFFTVGAHGVSLMNAKQGYAKNGLLRQVVYPTGGTLTYDYDQNQGLLNGTNTTIGGVHVVRTSSTDGGYTNDCSHPQVTNYNYVMNGAGSASSLWGLEMPQNMLQQSSHYNSESKHFHFSLSCIACCYWQFQYPGILSRLQAISLTDMQNIMQALAPVLGVISIVMDVLDVINLVFVSSGFFAWAAVVVDVIGALLTIGLSCFSGDNSKDQTYYTWYSSDLNSASPLPLQFRRVEIVEGSGTMGKTVHEFTNSDDYAVWVDAGQNTDFSAKQRFAPWAYGLPKKVTEYDASGNIMRQRINTYDFSQARQLIGQCGKCYPFYLPSGLATPYVSCKCTVNKQYSQRNDTWENSSIYDDPNSYLATGQNPDVSVDFYGISTGWAPVFADTLRVFRRNDASRYVETVNNYYYNTNNLEINQVSTIESNGDQVIKQSTFANDYSSTQNAAIKTMLQNNMVTVPISTYSRSYSQNSPSAGYLGEQVKEYTQLSNGELVLFRTLQQRTAAPNQSIIPYSPDNANNASIYKVTQTSLYDTRGNLIGVQDEGGRLIANIYDYSDKCIVASIQNCNSLADAPAYTSFETGRLGGWTVNGTASIDNSSGITGTSSFILNSSNYLAAPINTAKPYTLSFWATSPMGVSGASSPRRSAPTINGYTYYEYDIPQGGNTVSVGGNGHIDELRLYPKMARMKTTTYDPLIGKTSECDENGRITYYEYDNLGRLRFIKDDNHAIMKMYEYNNVSAAKQNGCPGVYYNHLVSETFNRSNCGSGYIGADFTYTIPANTYSSAVSQADADAQAEAYLMTNGQSIADQQGQCLQLFGNDVFSITDTSQCDDGYTPGLVTYTVPANRYITTNKQLSNQMAMDDMNANAQAYANSPEHASCTLSTSPVWDFADGGQTSCQNVNGVTHKFYYCTDINPNSSSYGTMQWIDGGVSSDCPQQPNVYAHISYENVWVDTYGFEHGDIIVRFYSDFQMTQTMSVTNLPIYWGAQWEFDESTFSGSLIANGTYAVIASNTPITAPDPTCNPGPPYQECLQYMYSYYLTPGNYIPD